MDDRIQDELGYCCLSPLSKQEQQEIRDASELALYRRMIKWLDAEEGRTLTLISANADFSGPSHAVEFSSMEVPPQMLYGESREALMTKIENYVSPLNL